LATITRANVDYFAGASAPSALSVLAGVLPPAHEK
jgi:hypothetical protein